MTTGRKQKQWGDLCIEEQGEHGTPFLLLDGLLGLLTRKVEVGNLDLSVRDDASIIALQRTRR